MIDSTTIKHDPYKIIQPKVRIETPIGAIESDSGNHFIDGITIVTAVLILYIGKKVVDKWFKK